MATFEPTDYQRGVWAQLTAEMAAIDPSMHIPDIEGQEDNGDGERNLIIHTPLFTITIPPEPRVDDKT